jgi:formate-dependent nitrite reductase cytochrome c552 subunit
MEVAGVTCVNCHMGRIAFRSAETSNNTHPAGDGSSHVFLTATPSLKKASGLRSACDSCHSKGVPMLDEVEWAKQHVFSNDELIAKMEEKKAQVKAAIKAVNQALSGWEPSAPEARALVDQANAKISFVVLDGSHGLHNTPKALRMLDEALQLARSAAAIDAKYAGTPRAPNAGAAPSEARVPGRSAQNNGNGAGTGVR